MTQPRAVIPGGILLTTRRTIDRRLVFSPDPVVNQTARFNLARSAETHGIELHAHCFLSNHHHTVATDPLGTDPDFRRDFHHLMSSAINEHRGLEGARWAPFEGKPMYLWDRESILDRVAYTCANPVRHHLVDEPEEWPGFISSIEDLAGPGRMVQRPDNYFDPYGTVPQEVELRFVKPKALADLTDHDYREEIRNRVAAYCDRARAERKRNRTTVFGRLNVLKQDPLSTPKREPEPSDNLQDDRRRKAEPLVKCLTVKLRIAVMQWLSWFVDAHREARTAHESGDVNVEFPFGTFWHSRRYGVNCATAGPPPLPAPGLPSS